MSETMENLLKVRGHAWADLVPAIDHAIVLAEEAEALAAIRSDEYATHIVPTYPALVRKIAEAGRNV